MLVLPLRFNLKVGKCWSARRATVARREIKASIKTFGKGHLDSIFLLENLDPQFECLVVPVLFREIRP
jgi:hypothetical protein